MPSQDGETSPLELFTRSQVAPNLKHMHTFGCPIYALNNILQTGKTIPKLSPRARLGVNLGSSPRHGRQTSLVLNPLTGLMSPQFHISHDDYFKTTSSTSDNPPTHLMWQRLSGLHLLRYNKFNNSLNQLLTDPNDVNVKQRLTSHTADLNSKIMMTRRCQQQHQTMNLTNL